MTGPARRGWFVGCAVAALLSAFSVEWGDLPKVSDETGYLPMARDAADPGLYSANDLLLATGRAGPFFMYRAASVLYRGAHAVDLWWFLLYVASLFAAFVAVWWIARGAGGSAIAASVVTALIAAASPFRGTINWFLAPPPNLVISTLALPAILAAIALALNGRRGWGLVIASAAFNLHPSMGLLTATAIAVLMVHDAVTRGPDALAFDSIAKWWAAAIVVALPTVLFVARSTPGNFAVADAATFRRVFDLYSWHVSPADHWREGYGFFLLATGAAVLLAGPRKMRDALVLIAAFLVMIAIGFINRSALQVVSVDLVFLVRVAPFVKVLAWVIVVAAVASRWRAAAGRGRVELACAGSLLVVAALAKNASIAEGALAMACGALAFVATNSPSPARAILAAILVVIGAVEVAAEGWRTFGIARFTAPRLDDVRLVSIAAGAVWLAWAAWQRWHRAPGDETSDATDVESAGRAVLAAGLVCATALVLQARASAFVPATPRAVRERIRIGVPDSSVRDLMSWASRTPRGSLFSVPPVDPRFGAFRLAAGRGVHILSEDVVYVLYDAAMAGEAHQRVLRSGVVVRGRHDFDEAPYQTLAADSVRALARAGVDYAIFSAPARLTRPLDFPIAYQDSRWIAYDVRSKR